MPAAECPQSVLRLVDLFDRNRSTYRSRDYLERDARTQFIEPLFEALEQNGTSRVSPERDGRLDNSTWCPGKCMSCCGPI